MSQRFEKFSKRGRWQCRECSGTHVQDIKLGFVAENRELHRLMCEDCGNIDQKKFRWVNEEPQLEGRVKRLPMSRMVTVGSLLCVLALTGCEAMGTAAQSKTTQGAVLGGLLGAGTGAIVGEQKGKAGAGTAIGAGLGALGGGLVGSALEAQDKKLQQQQMPPATGQTKFCPVGGEVYAEGVKFCPNHGVELRYKGQ